MKRLRSILECSLICSIILLLSVLFLTIISYFHWFNNDVIMIIKYIIPIISLGLGGFLIGRKSIKNGWLEGLLFALFFVFFMIVITILLSRFKIEYLLYVTILVVSGILGSVIGINQNS